jgi:uncharacterized protein YceK
MKIRLLVLLAVLLGLSGCSTMYYGAMEKMGYTSATSWWTASRQRETQKEAKEQF